MRLCRKTQKGGAFKKETRALFTKWQQQKASLQVLRLCTTSRFTSFDPRTGTEEETSYLHKMLFEGLMRIGQEGEPEAAIAEKVSISEDGKSYRFFLRKSTWSNGMPLTAHDFLYSWKMVLTRKDLAPLSYLFDCIENAQEIKEGAIPIDTLGVKVIDDYTLEVKLLSPCTPFLETCALTLFSPICLKVDQQHPSWAEAEGDEYVCNGPFCLEKKETNGGVVLKKNTHYWKAEKVRLEKVTIPMVSEEEGKELFLDQKIDALLYYFFKNSNKIPLDNPAIKRLEGAISVSYLCFNCKKPPFHNKKVRKAINLVIDRKKLAKAYSEEAVPTCSFYFPFDLQEQTRNNSNTQNIHKARQLLIDALAEDPSVRANLFNQSFFVIEKNKNFAEFFCNDFNRTLHFDWKVSVLKNSSSKNYFALKNYFNISLLGWTYRIRDARYFLAIFAAADNFANLPCWTHPSIQSTIEQLKSVQTDEENRKLFDFAKNLLHEEEPMIPLFYRKLQSFYQTYIRDIHINDLQRMSHS